MKNTNKKTARSLSDWRALYYTFKGARLVINILTAIIFIGIIIYSFYHYLFVSQSYTQDNETTWLLISLFIIMGLWVILTISECRLKDKYIAAKKRAKQRRDRQQITIQDMMDIHESVIIEEIINNISQEAVGSIDASVLNRINQAPEISMEELESNCE